MISILNLLTGKSFNVNAGTIDMCIANYMETSDSDNNVILFVLNSESDTIYSDIENNTNVVSRTTDTMLDIFNTELGVIIIDNISETKDIITLIRTYGIFIKSDIKHTYLYLITT